MIIKEVLSEPGKSYNEDLITYGGNYLLLLDGATGLAKNRILGEESDAIWFVSAVAYYIHQKIDQFSSLKDLLRPLTQHLHQSYERLELGEVERIDHPSSGMTLLREKDHSIELLMLADGTTIVEKKDGSIEVLHDERVTKLDQSILDKMIQISRKENLPLNATRRFVEEDLRNNRLKKNQKEGYSVLDFITPIDFLYREYKRDEIKSICLFSDGVAEAYETLDLYKDIESFYYKVVSSGAKQVLKEIREKQKEDMNCNRYPRLKPMDDASIALIEIEE